ncbi:MAG: carbohydrate kinase family protein [Methanophagales archaeon]|nr:carbohydrate kinase family protein [Methanophagales archaeon]MCW3141896.1 carbohydrate kinase family protein [Methanophagales archaeon]
MAVKQKGASGEGRKRKGDYDVVLIGDAFYDIATMPVRDYPERDKQIGCEFMLSIGGQAGNCAAACASLGLKTALICKTGDDVLSKWIISELQKLGVNCFATIAQKEEFPHSGITVSISFEDGSRSMLSDRGANLDLKEEDMDFELLTETSFLMRAGHWNTEGLFAANNKILRIAKSAGVSTGVDIGWSAYLGWTESARQTVFDFLPSTDFLFVNEAEIKGLSGKERGEHELLERGCENVIIHRGAKGSSWVNRDFEISCPAFKVKPISPTGVGDVFNAGFIYAFLEGKDAEECLKFANACAAAHISKKRLRNVVPTIKDVDSMLEAIYK